MTTSIGDLQETSFTQDARGPLALTLLAGTYLLDVAGRIQQADSLLERLATLADAMDDREPVASVLWHLICAARDAYARRIPWSAFEHSNAALVIARATGHERYLGFAQLFLGMNLWLLGAHGEAERTLTEIALPDEAFGATSSVRPFCLAWMFAERGDFGAALACAGRIVASGQARRQPLDEGHGRWVLSEALRRTGELDAADGEIQAARELLGTASPLDHPGALATLSALRLAQGRPAEALVAAEEGLSR
jgi:hypothetical protein